MGIMIKRNINEKSFNRSRASNAFNSGRKKIKSTNVYSDFAHRNLVRRSYKPKDTDPGSFGGKKVKKATGQFRYSKNKKSVKKRDGFFYDLFGVFKEKNKKKKEPEMDLFDKKMKKNLKF
jgi:hypothetical protein